MEQVQLPLTMLVTHVRVPVQILAVLLSIKLPDKVLRKIRL